MWATEQMSREELNNLLLVQDKYRITACYVALRWGSVEVIDHCGCGLKRF